MQIRLLGTGAADGVPALFGTDRVSRYAREHCGRDVRSRASALIDGVIKLDLPPDALMQSQLHNVDASLWQAILFTHRDDDHLAKNQLQYALYPFTERDHADFGIYGNEAVIAAIHERFPDWPLELHTVHAFRSYEVHDYLYTPVLATHTVDEECHNLLIEKDGKRFLYATDTGVYGEETFGFLAGKMIDALVIECTDGRAGSEYSGHLDIKECIHVVERLRRSGGLRPEAPVVTTHHSARGEATYAELKSDLVPHGIEPGYDGMILGI